MTQQRYYTMEASSAVEWFVDDDVGYLAWLAAHPDGLVLNAWAHVDAGYLVLHRARCRTINRDLAEGRVWTHQYGKACAMSAAELRHWADEAAGGVPRPCKICAPDAGTPDAPSAGPRSARRGGRAARPAPLDPVDRYDGPPIRVVVEKRDGGARLVIDGAERLALTFFRRDPSALGPKSYDAWAHQTPRERIVWADILAINGTMAARSAHKWWNELIDGDGATAELAAIDLSWDLIELTAPTWEAMDVAKGLDNLLKATMGRGRGIAVATKVLHLKRPRLIPVADSLVLQQVGVRGSTPLAAILHLREVGRRNADELRAIQQVLSLYGIERSLVRILDALLWTSHPASVLAKDLTGWQSVMRQSTSEGSDG